MKQAILVRMDLKMPKGKLATQCSHAAVSASLKSSPVKIKKWKSSGMKKVILKVKDKRELLKYKQLAGKEKLVQALVTDAGKTYFKRATTTCLAIGPDEDKKIDLVTSNLKLL